MITSSEIKSKINLSLVSILQSMCETMSQSPNHHRISLDFGRHSFPPEAVCEVWQWFVLAVLDPSIPSLESMLIEDLLGTHDVFLYIVTQIVLAALIAVATSMPSSAPLDTVDLKDTIRIAGTSLWTSYQMRVHPTFVLHQADPVADEGPTDSGYH